MFKKVLCLEIKSVVTIERTCHYKEKEQKNSSQISFVTCEPHSAHEDTLNLSGSASCMQRLENPSSDTFDRDLQSNLSLQAQGR